MFVVFGAYTLYMETHNIFELTLYHYNSETKWWLFL